LQSQVKEKHVGQLGQDRPARLVDIAREVGVSRATVGKVLLKSGSNIRVARDTARRIRETARKLNYRPNRIARQLTGAASGLIAVFVESVLNPVSQQRLWATEAEARGSGFRTLICQLGQDADVAEYVQDFESYNVEAILYLGTRESTAAALGEVTANVISSVRIAGDSVYYVELDRRQASRLAVSHLLERDRRRVGLVMPPQTSDLGHEKYHGYLDGLKAAGLTYGEDLISVTDVSDPVKGMERAIDELVDARKCDAIIATSDAWAVLLIKALKRRGMDVPGDVAIIGFDNLDMATAVDPELTTIDHQHHLAAVAMVGRLMELTGKQELTDSEEGRMIPPKLIVRQST